MSPTLPEPLNPPEKRRPIPKRVRLAVEEIVQGRAKTITAAAKKVGLTREYLSRSLSEPHITEHLRLRAARTVAIGAGRASARLIGLLDARSEHVVADVATRILAISGISAPREQNVNFNLQIRAGYVINLSEDPPMRVVSPPATKTSDEGRGHA